MENSVQKIKFIFFSIILLFFGTFAFSQEKPSQENEIRIQIWAELDQFPGKFETNETPNTENYENQSDFQKQFSYSINRTKEISPFLIAGMLNGWNFEYTPSDKKRRVEEFWDFSLINEFNPQINTLEFNNIHPEDNKLISWVHCKRTNAQISYYKSWLSVIHPKIKGIGKASVELEFEGIKEACSQAAKNAVREYWRTQIKNKPKEISGKLLLIGNPRIYIKEGQYIVDLDFFLETDRIVEYKLF
jgi:hypothetical protein